MKPDRGPQFDPTFAALVFALAALEWLRYPVAGSVEQLGRWSRREWLFAYCAGVASRPRPRFFVVSPEAEEGDVECVVCGRRMWSGESIVEDSPICRRHRRGRR